MAGFLRPLGSRPAVSRDTERYGGWRKTGLQGSAGAALKGRQMGADDAAGYRYSEGKRGNEDGKSG